MDRAMTQCTHCGATADCKCISPAYAAELGRQVDELEAENAQLREALKKIVAIKDDLYGSDWQEIEEARSIAADALSR
jgi:hypothetical protein